MNENFFRRGFLAAKRSKSRTLRADAVVRPSQHVAKMRTARPTRFACFASWRASIFDHESGR
jgi:hypothetical protein